MMKNKLSNLNDHLFEQLERLNDSKLVGEKLTVEIDRTKAMKSIAQEIIAIGRLALDAQKELGNSIPNGDLPEMLEVKRPKALGEK